MSTSINNYFFKYLENEDVKCYCITYPNDSVKPLLLHNLSKHLIPINYQKYSFYSLDELSAQYPILKIENYFSDKKLNRGDVHLTLDGHKIISDSIYNKKIRFHLMDLAPAC